MRGFRTGLMLMLMVLGGCVHAPPRGGAPGDVKVLDAGASPRRVLRYGDTSGLEHAVALSWRGSSQSSSSSCFGGWSSTVIFDDVALTGTLAGQGAGRLALVFDNGTTTPHESEFFHRGVADLREFVPTRFALAAHRDHVALSLDGKVPYGDGLASEFSQLAVVAMPRLPIDAIGVGARWEITDVRGQVTRRATWNLIAVTASRITVDGTIMESTRPRPWSNAGVGPWSKTITVRADVDLDGFALRAEIERLTVRDGDSSASSTTSLAILPR